MTNVTEWTAAREAELSAAAAKVNIDYIADRLAPSGCWLTHDEVEAVFARIKIAEENVRRLRHSNKLAGEENDDLRAELIDAAYNSPEDDEEFCPDCFAGMESDQHREQCTLGRGPWPGYLKRASDLRETADIIESEGYPDVAQKTRQRAEALAALAYPT